MASCRWLNLVGRTAFLRLPSIIHTDGYLLFRLTNRHQLTHTQTVPCRDLWFYGEASGAAVGTKTSTGVGCRPLPRRKWHDSGCYRCSQAGAITEGWRCQPQPFGGGRALREHRGWIGFRSWKEMAANIGTKKQGHTWKDRGGQSVLYIQLWAGLASPSEAYDSTGNGPRGPLCLFHGTLGYKKGFTVSVELHRTILLTSHPPQPNLTRRTTQLSAREAGGWSLH